jgi:Holliday junction resolvase RusA-like endonuclease
MKALYYLPHKGGMPDLVGLLQGTCDILEKGGVVDNDRQIVGFDGSRIAGFDRLNPRTEIVLEPVRA